MLRLILIINFLLMAAAAAPANADVVIAAGTELPATNNSIIDSGAMDPGADVNFTLSKDVTAASITIPVGSTIYGRVVEAQKFNGGKAPARLLIMFDYLQVGEEFYPISALMISSSSPQTELQMKKSDTEACAGCTTVTLKGGDIRIPEGTAFVIRIEENVEN